MDWVNLLQTFGVTTVACVSLAAFLRDQIKKQQDQAAERERLLTNRVQQLEDEFRKTLIPLLQKNQEVITENTVAMKTATAAFGIGKETRDKIQAIKEHP